MGVHNGVDVILIVLLELEELLVNANVINLNHVNDVRWEYQHEGQVFHNLSIRYHHGTEIPVQKSEVESTHVFWFLSIEKEEETAVDVDDD